MTRKLASILLATTLSVAVIVPAQAQWAVFDASNYAQNLLEADRALQEVNNQVLQLQNEATMLQNMGQDLASLNTSQLPTMLSALTEITTLMNQEGGIAFTVGATNGAWNTSFPSSYALNTPTATLASDAQTRWQQAMAAFQQTLQIQAQVAQNVQADSSTLSTLVSASQGAIGNLQATQATNQLLALSTKQQLQIQNLMAAQYRASALDSARDAESEAAAQSEFTTFIGNGQAYTPQ